MQVYAKKLLTPELEAKARQEIDILGRASHASVLMLIDTLETTTSLILVLEHCTHGDLVKEIVLNRSAAAFATVCTRLKQIIQAVQHIHKLVRLDQVVPAH